MNIGAFEPISDEALRRIAGPKTYDRGAAYYAEGRAEILVMDGRRVLARVQGSEPYLVELRPSQGQPGGVCDCPAFGDTGFCKHLVAVALAANQAIAEERPPTDRLAAARRYLVGQGVEALAERLLRQALRDPTLLEEIELDAADSVEDDGALAARYRAAIDEACDADEGVDWYGAQAFAEDIGRIVDRLEGLAAGRASLALELLEHLFDQMEDVSGAVDDSEGEVTAVLARAAEVHLQACCTVRPDPLKLAESLLERELAGNWITFEDAAETYAEVLGPDGLAEFHRLAMEAWNAAGGEGSWTLKSILDGFAQRAGDLEARIALRKADLKRPQTYVEIAKLLAEAGRRDEALKWLEEGIWCFEDNPDESLHGFAADLMMEAGRVAEADNLLWAAFKRWPSLAQYRRLQQAFPEAAPRIERALDILRGSRSKSIEPWRQPHIVMLEIQMAEGLIDQAWETAQSHEVGYMRLEALADASAKTHPRHATAVYEQLIEDRLKGGGAGNYDAAMVLIGRRAATASASHAAYLADLAVRHKAKRTFIARLQTLR